MQTYPLIHQKIKNNATQKNEQPPQTLIKMVKIYV